MQTLFEISAFGFVLFYLFYLRDYEKKREERKQNERRKRMSEYLKDPEQAKVLRSAIANGTMKITDPKIADEFDLK